MLTADVLHAARHNTLKGQMLCDWAEALIINGIETDTIIEALGNPDMHWERVNRLFDLICEDIGICKEFRTDMIPLLFEEAVIEEYRHGYRSAGELLHRNDNLRKRIGLPEQVMLRIMEDNNDGTNDSGFYSLHSRVPHWMP
jgi:hypothetical protein